MQPHAEDASERDHLLEAAGLSTDYTFDTFVKGASNQFALAASLRVAETPARSYNPLFIYGSAGLGKTHLLYAIGHYVHSNYRHHKIRYVSTETFMNEYVESIRQNTTNFLRQRYREIDVLLIDDIQFIANKEGSPGRVLPHVQRTPRREQADRHQLRSHARRHSRRWKNASGAGSSGD